MKNKEEIPIVVPVIFYHGKKMWEMKPLFDYFKGVDENLKQYIPVFKYILTDLNKMPDKVIIKEKFRRNINKVMVLLFRHIWEQGYIEEQLEDIFSLLKDFFTEDKKEIIVSFLLYIMSTTDISDKYIEKCLNSISHIGGQITMTTAMKLRQEGLKKGIREKAIETAKKMLLKKYPIKDIIEITGLTKEEIKKL